MILSKPVKFLNGNAWLEPRKALPRGFTIVELLIVIVIIGILATLVITMFVGAQQRARVARAQSEVKQMGRLVMAIRDNGGYGTLAEMTGSNFSSYTCYDIGNIQRLPKTHQCWIDYNTLLDRLEAQGNNSLSAFRDGDPWGAPYILDENEGEVNGGDCERQDVIKSAGPDGIYDNGSDDISWRMLRQKPTADC